MKKISKLLCTFLIIISFCFIDTVNAVYSDSQVGTYEQELAKFPASYQEKIKNLHDKYPNAIFVAQDKFFYWGPYYKEMTVDWKTMLKSQIGNKSYIEFTAKDSYKTDKCGERNNEGVCTWYYASEEAISYYLDPRNFLNEKHVFMFESQYYKDYQTLEGVKNILKGTFMEEKKCPGSNADDSSKEEKTYAEVIIEAAKVNDVSPYMLAARLRQEQGKDGTSSLISGTYKGYEGYYNYFNIQAGGNTDKIKIENGLKCASGTLVSSKGTELCKGNSWTTPYLSIIGGSKFLKKDYIGINDTYNVKGQMTNYLQKFDPYGPVLGGHQYMQNIQAPTSEAITTYNSYSKDANFKNYKFIFYIPVYQKMPNSLNIKIDGIYVTGINVGKSHSSYINEIKESLTNADVSIEKNLNNKTENLATGDILKINNDNKEEKYIAIIYGDINGDSLIDKKDLLSIQSHVFGYTKFNDIQIKAANIQEKSEQNVDKKDLLSIQSHVFGYSKISQG